MKFIADSMLGRLARWLRLLGHDTLYFSVINDGRLLRIAREEGRIILTRDSRLAKVRDIPEHLILKDNDTFKQLGHVLKAFGLEAKIEAGAEGGLSARCMDCNDPLEKVSGEDARGHVPEYVLQTNIEFRRCPSCRRFYWRGTHYERIRKKLADISYN